MRSRSAGSMLPRVASGALRLVTRDGAVEREWPLLLSSHPHQFSRWSGGIWIHAEMQHLCFGDSAEPLAVYGRGYEGMPGQLRVFGTQMLVFETTVLQQGRGWISEHATWVDLDTKLGDQRFTWDRQVGAALSFADDGVRIVTDEGVTLLVPGEQPRCLVRTRGAAWPPGRRRCSLVHRRQRRRSLR